MHQTCRGACSTRGTFFAEERERESTREPSLLRRRLYVYCACGRLTVGPLGALLVRPVVTVHGGACIERAERVYRMLLAFSACRLNKESHETVAQLDLM